MPEAMWRYDESGTWALIAPSIKLLGIVRVTKEGRFKAHCKGRWLQAPAGTFATLTEAKHAVHAHLGGRTATHEPTACDETWELLGYVHHVSGVHKGTTGSVWQRVEATP